MLWQGREVGAYSFVCVPLIWLMQRCPFELGGQAFIADESLAPIRQTFQESGMSEDELETLFEEARARHTIKRKSSKTQKLQPD
jgi:hypothetical protein